MHFPLPVSHISSGSFPRKSPDFSPISHRRGLPQEKWPELSGYRPLYIGQSKRGKKFAPAHCVSRGIFFRAAPHNGTRRFGQCFDPGESMENGGILDVFPIFHTARLGQKIRRSPQLPPKRCCLRFSSSAKARQAGCLAEHHGPFRSCFRQRNAGSILAFRRQSAGFTGAY